MKPFQNGDPMWLNSSVGDMYSNPQKVTFIGICGQKRDRAMVEMTSGTLVSVDPLRLTPRIVIAPPIEERAWAAVLNYEAMYVDRDTKDIDPTGTSTLESSWDTLDWAYAAILYELIVDAMQD